MRKVARVALAIVLACAACLGAGMNPGLTPEAHALPEYAATVEFDSITADANGVTLTGVLTSTGTGLLYEVEAALWSIPDPITTPAALATILGSEADVDEGERASNPGATAVIVAEDIAFNPGQTAVFTVTATWEELGLSADAVYVVGVHVRACDEPGAPLVTIGTGRTLATLARSTTTTPSTVVMLTSAPSLIHDNVFFDDHLASELTGRLADLLTLARQPGVTWVIDPALHHEIAIMAQGYEIQRDEGTIPGNGEASAASWLRSFDELHATMGYRLPWGNPDLVLGATVEDPHMPEDARAALAASPADESRIDVASLPLMVRAGDGFADDAFLSYVAALEPAIVLANTTGHAMAGDMRVLATMPTPYPDGLGPDAPTSDPQRTQRAVAEDFVNHGSIRVIDNTEDARLARVIADPGTRPAPLASIGVTTDWTSALSTGSPTARMTPEVLAAIHAARDVAADYAVLIDDADAVRTLGSVPLAAGSSQSWPDAATALDYLSESRVWLGTFFSGLTLTATPEVSLTSRVSSFPVTVTNGLAVPIHVRIVSATTPVGRSPANVSIPLTEVHVIQPGDKLTLSLTPMIVREGDIDALLRLATSNGSPIGEPVTVRVHATMSAWMGWVVVGGAFVLFIVGTFLRVRSARKKGNQQ